MILCVILMLFLLLAAAPCLCDAVAGFDGCDDAAALITGDTGPVELTADSGWGLTARLEKADLAPALHLPDGTPAVIFDTAEGQFAGSTIQEALYQELLTAERLPVLCASDIPRPEQSKWLWICPGTEGLSDVYFVLCGQDEQ